MASNRMTSNQRPISIACSLLVVLLGACGNNATNEKVDAGQRRYCSTEAGPDQANREIGGGLDTQGGVSIDTAPDIAASPDLPSERVAAETHFDEVAPLLDSGPLDGSAIGVDGAGDSRDSGGPDAAPDVPPTSSSDAKDAPVVLNSDAAADFPPDLAGDLADVAPDVADAPGEPGPEGPPDVPAVDTSVAPDALPGFCFNNPNSSAWAQGWTHGSSGPGGVALAAAGLAAGTDGTLWTTGTYNRDFDFNNPSGPSITYLGTSQSRVFVAKMDPGTGLASAAFGFGETVGSDTSQFPLGISVASGASVGSVGNVGVFGVLQGEIDFTGSNQTGDGPSGQPGTAGSDFLFSGSPVNFYAVFDGNSSGTYITPKLAHMVDVGVGTLLAIASNPAQNAFAICGKTTKVVPNWNANNPGTTKGVITGGSATFGGGNSDLIVFKVDGTTGAVIWGKQYKGAGGTTDGDQVCESVAMDSSGNVFVAGNYSGDLFGLPNVADTTGATGVLFLAKLNAADGTLASAVSWAGTGVSHAFALAVDASNNIVMAGGLNTNIDFGNGTGPTAWTGSGNNDAFVVKFNSSMVAQWAVADGDAGFDQNAKSVATDSSGNVVLGGTFTGTLPNLFHLTSAGIAATDAFSAKLSATNGSLLFAHAYGDALGAQAMTVVSVAPTGTLADAIFVGGGFGGTINLGTMLVSPSVQACTLAVGSGMDGGSGGCPGVQTCVCGFCANSEAIGYFISRLAP